VVHRLCWISIAAVVALATPVSGAWFMPLPQLPGSAEAGDAFAISADGLTVVGKSHDGAVTQAVRWTIAPQPVVEPLGAGGSSISWGVSANGNIVVGNLTSAEGYPIAFRWTQAGGVVLLGDFPGAVEASVANGVSADGQVIVGRGRTEQAGEAFRWTAQTGLVSLGDLPGGAFGSEAYATSANGSLVVGSGLSAQGTEAFRWSLEAGMIGLGDLPGGGFFSEAYGVSADGSIVVGRSFANSGLFPSRAFRWTVTDGMVPLPDILGIGPVVTAQGISGNGVVIVGAAVQGDNARAFVWDAFHGSRALADILTAQGVDLHGFDIGKANAVSFDGLTIVGSGLPSGSLRPQPWVARLDPETFVPEPPTVVIAGITLILLVATWLLRRIATRRPS
jgi:uncharacterized membrane protein